MSSTQLGAYLTINYMYITYFIYTILLLKQHLFLLFILAYLCRQLSIHDLLAQVCLVVPPSSSSRLLAGNYHAVAYMHLYAVPARGE